MNETFFTLRTVIWLDGKVRMIDQTALPGRLTYRTYADWQGVAEAIRTMVIRGAPAIGVAAAMGVALAAYRSRSRTPEELLKEMETAAKNLRATRPTAVNLFWGIERVMRKARTTGGSVDSIKDALAREVAAMADEDVEANKRIGMNGAAHLEDGDVVLTQCNAGALATVGYGTALGVVRAARDGGKCIKVIVPETRPALQGARLTAFELERDGFDCTVISDTAVGYTLAARRVNKVIVGADRITKDGYVFNKIGTYQMAVLAKRHGVPFYPAAPHSTFDLERNHDQVDIEERSFDEVAKVKGRRIVPKGVSISNPAFDSTPPELVSAIISDRGVIDSPVERKIASVIR